MPLRASALTRAIDGLSKGAEMRIYGQVAYGKLANIYLLDDRQYRDRQVCNKGFGFGSGWLDPDQCEAWLDPNGHCWVPPKSNGWIKPFQTHDQTNGLGMWWRSKPSLAGVTTNSVKDAHFGMTAGMAIHPPVNA